MFRSSVAGSNWKSADRNITRRRDRSGDEALKHKLDVLDVSIRVQRTSRLHVHRRLSWQCCLLNANGTVRIRHSKFGSEGLCLTVVETTSGTSGPKGNNRGIGVLSKRSSLRQETMLRLIFNDFDGRYFFFWRYFRNGYRYLYPRETQKISLFELDNRSINYVVLEEILLYCRKRTRTQSYSTRQ